MRFDTLIEPGPHADSERPRERDSQKILLACDRPRIGRVLCHLLEEEGYEVDEACDGGAVVSLLVHQPYELVLIDVPLGPVANLAMLQILWRWKQSSRIPVLICGGTQALESFAQGVDDTLTNVVIKPCSKALLLARIALALDKRSAYRFMFPLRRAPEVTQQSGTVGRGPHADGPELADLADPRDGGAIA